MDNENTTTAVSETEEDTATMSPTAPRFSKVTQRGAKRTINMPNFHQELQRRKMVRDGAVTEPDIQIIALHRIMPLFCVSFRRAH